MLIEGRRGVNLGSVTRDMGATSRYLSEDEWERPKDIPAGEGIPPDEAEPAEPTCILLSSTELYRPWPLTERTMRGEYDMIDESIY